MAETAPLLTEVWGELAPTVATLVVAEPALARRLMLSPTRAIHATAAYVHHARNAGTPIGSMAATMLATDPRELLAAAIADAHPRLYRLLDHLGPEIRKLAFYTRLNAALHGPNARMLLDGDRIVAPRLELAERADGNDPVLRAMGPALWRQPQSYEAIEGALAWARGLGVAQDAEALPEGGGAAALLRRIQRDVSRLAAPPIRLDVPAGWRRVETVRDLWAAARALGNCVRPNQHWSPRFVHHLLRGDVFLVTDAADMLAHLQPIGGPFWLVRQVSGRGSYQDARKAQKALIQGFAALGVRIVEDHPLDTLLRFAEPAGDGDDDDDDDDEGELVDGLAAAEAIA